MRRQTACSEHVTGEQMRACCPQSPGLTARAVLSIVMRQARARAVPYPAYIAAHGIMLGLTSSRCSAAVRSWIEALTPDEMLGLVSEVAGVCVTIGEVPRYLNARAWPARHEASPRQPAPVCGQNTG